MTTFLAIGLGVLNLWRVEFCPFSISRRSPWTQCWRYRDRLRLYCTPCSLR